MSMTGFGSHEIVIAGVGKVSIELRSTNHKFLETVLHLPEGLLSLEDKFKKEIESKIKRGRVTCVVNIARRESTSVFIDEKLLKNYILALENTKKKFHINGEVGLDDLIRLPGVLSIANQETVKEEIYPRLKGLLSIAVNKLVGTRQKEGAALYRHLKRRSQKLKSELHFLQARYKNIVERKKAKLNTQEEQSSFLKESDISEEIERLGFHIKNFSQKLSKNSPIGKELDFIAQEMQREANTTGAKCCDSLVSVRVIQMKSQIEKIREQVQNIE
ncbi:MAG: YicC/YloC family endoribonuclease [Candidatus Omnitrophota bacterium]